MREREQPPTVLVLVLEEGAELADADAGKRLASVAVVQHAAGDAGPNALIQKRDGRGRRNEVGDGRKKLADEPRLMRGEERELKPKSTRPNKVHKQVKKTHAFHDLDEHPVVGRG